MKVEDLKTAFPTGEWGIGQKAYMVKDGTYHCAAATVEDGVVTLTELGLRLTGAVSVDVVADDAPAVPKAPVKLSAFKRRAAQKRAVTEPDDLDL